MRALIYQGDRINPEKNFKYFNKGGRYKIYEKLAEFD